MNNARALKSGPMTRRMYSQSNRNPDGAADEPAAPPPQYPRQPRQSSGFGKTILIAGLGAVAGAFAIDMYNKLFKGKGRDEGEGEGEGPRQQGNVITPQVMSPAVIPMPMPYPTPMPGWGGGYGPPPAPERNGGSSDRERVAAVRGRRNAMEELRTMKQDAFDKLCDKFMEGDD